MGKEKDPAIGRMKRATTLIEKLGDVLAEASSDSEEAFIRERIRELVTPKGA